MTKSSFRPCNTCSLPCKYAKGKAPNDQSAIDRLIEEQKIKTNGCPYK